MIIEGLDNSPLSDDIALPFHDTDLIVRLSYATRMFTHYANVSVQNS